MLPSIPDKLRTIDESTVAEHFSLESADRCFFIWEYVARQRYDVSPTNQLIKNFKIKPNDIVKSPGRSRHKAAAIEHAANAFRSLVSRDFVSGRATFVPVPGSKVPGDPDFDDRLAQTLQRAYGPWSPDIRCLLEQSTSTPADHECDERLAFSDLYANTRVNPAAIIGVRPLIVIVDDVLNSGKHFKVAQRRILEHIPDAQIRGLFLARCIRPLASTEVL